MPSAVSPLRILVAEDVLANRTLLAIRLRSLGYTADLVDDGIEAIARLQHQPYDLILMDVQMPRMDGLETSRWITREWPRERRPRIIALTASVLPEDQQACLDAGMDEFLVKPVEPARLADALRRCPRLPL